MRPQMRPSSRLTTGLATDVDGPEKSEKKEEKYFPGPLPVVKLTHTSDWADDERDTGLSLPERGRYRGPDVDAPSRELYKDDRDAAGSWRAMPQPRDERAGMKPFGVGREVNRDSGSARSSPYGNSVRDGLSNGRDLGFGMSSQNGKNLSEGFSGRGSDQQNVRGGRYGDVLNNRHRGDGFQHNAVAKSPFSYGSKGLSLNDPILDFGREKRMNSSNSGKQYYGDAGFDATDPFSDDPIAEVNMKVFKKKKEVQKHADYHDPVRESFEAELERVQRIQEQERQRAMEEQARVMEIARREQEERERLVREEEERRRLMEEEAREAAWRAEQEKMEVARKAEEQKIAREEEKRRMLMEEERRKENARKKLMELEARIARRETEVSQNEDQFPRVVGDERAVGTSGRDVPKVTADMGEWEDGERMVEHITSTSSDSSMNRYFETGSSRLPSRETGSSFMDRGKHVNYWKRDSYDGGASSMFHEQDSYARRDTYSPGRGYPRKDSYGSLEAAPMRPSSKGSVSDHSSGPDDFRYLRGNRWNVGGEIDHFPRNFEADAADFFDSERFDDSAWGSIRPRGSPNAWYAERSFPNSEVDSVFPSHGRSRHSLRQPRVLPPPSISSTRQSQSSFRVAADRPISSSFVDNQSRYQHGGRSVEEPVQSNYDGGYHQRVQQSRTPEVLESDVISSEQREKDSPRCDSQSSLSVSNPPSSPTQLSHDELDEAEDSQALETAHVEEQTVLSDSGHIMSGMEMENMNRMATASSVSHGEDDEWEIENNEGVQEQEVYDEEDGGYQEEEEVVHEGDGGRNLDLSQEFDAQTLDTSNLTHEMGQLISSFDDSADAIIPMADDPETSGNLEKAVQKDVVGDRKVQVENSFAQESASESSQLISETENSLQQLALDPVSSFTSNIQPIASPLSLPVPSTSTVQPISSMASNSDGQAEAPIRLQFGLFSGPSLIPSPVPAIQIGSIQMPLHLHPQVGTSITQMHPPQPSFFQFGQLRYPSSISQGMLPLAPQTMSFVHPPVTAQYPSTQNLVGSGTNQANQDSSSQNNQADKLPSRSVEEQAGPVTKPLDHSEENKKMNFVHLNEMPDPPNSEVLSRGQSNVTGDKNRQFSGYQNDGQVIRDVTSRKNYRNVMNNRESQVHPGDVPSQLSLGEKAQIGTRAPGIISSSRGRRFTYTVRNAGTRSQFSGPENSRTDSSVFQRRPRRSIRRTEFRVRESVDKRQREGVDTNNNTSQEERPNFTGRAPGTTVRYGSRKDASNKSTKVQDDSENLNYAAPTSQFTGSDGKIPDKLLGKDTKSKKRVSSIENSRAEGDNGKRSVNDEEDVDAPIQGGVVRIFKQPGIEAPSDEDDFIEVRSKRQMLNDRREQREKENKAKSKVIKAPRKHRVIPQNNAVASKSNKAVSALSRNVSQRVREPVIRGFTHIEASPVFPAMTCQTLPPIGTPPMKIDSETRSKSLKAGQTSTISGQSSAADKFVPGLSFENKTTGLGNASLSLGSWGNSDINQQVMALTQSQLDEAMKPVQFDSLVTSSSTISLEPSKPSTSIMAPEKPFPPSSSPLNSLLAGERIQFGAVTSPTILPPVSRAISNGIGPPGSSRSDVTKDALSDTNNDSTIFFDKDKHPDESRPHLEDPESEAEAAASAVAVAAISNNDEIVGSRLGIRSIPDSKSFSGTDNTDLKTSGGLTSTQEVTGQSASEESLTVSLPADLSVETPALPLWHPLPSPQSTSSPALSHFPGGPHSHFPVGFDMNPIFGGPIFAFGPHDESGGTQTQQRSTTLGSGPLASWPQCHSGVDSFYGPPAGFPGPYITPPGGIPGVQAPPHMVVYNHFAPVGQFGQVGLSFMGTTYIPTGKQPDWKHNPMTPAAVSVTEGDGSNANVVSSQHNQPNLPSPIQHLAPGSPLMPMASTLAMFDMSPFQSSPDMPYQARWSHGPAPPPIHSVPLTMPLQQQPQKQQQQPQPQQVDNRMPSQFGSSHPAEISTVKDRFHDPRSSTSGNSNRSFSVTNELRMAEPPTASNNKSSNNLKSSTTSSNNGAQNATSSSFKPQVSQKQQSASSGQQQYLHPIGSQKTSTGEWHHRRMGYQGRGQGSDKGFAPSKMKQIYVAKSTTSGNVTKS
ncbi:uncharacterized protein LOC109844497 [Asparagus officinalis]|uniref:uncharacterized protein LOC109844497 n=1 Tax=Asparagus officinalis TaxID=4686 RepID=UPI00098E4A80|nr:uncharacterized protein LOC109844497 [Asparagus officinalis]